MKNQNSIYELRFNKDKVYIDGRNRIPQHQAVVEHGIGDRTDEQDIIIIKNNNNNNRSARMIKQNSIYELRFNIDKVYTDGRKRSPPTPSCRRTRDWR